MQEGSFVVGNEKILTGGYVLSVSLQHNTMIFFTLLWSVLARSMLSTFLILLRNIWGEKIARLFWSIWIFEMLAKRISG